MEEILNIGPDFIALDKEKSMCGRFAGFSSFF